MIIKLTKNFLVFSVIATLALLAANTNSYGQDNDYSDYKNAVTFGLAHSLHFTTISGTFPSSSIANRETKISTSSPRFTFSIGTTTDFHINKMVSIQFDFLYTYMGAHLLSKTYLYNEVGVIENKEYYTYAMDYFKFPLTVNFYPMRHIYMNGGGYFSTLISSSRYSHWYENREPIDDIKPIDYGIIAGFGFNTPYAKIGFQYSYGLNNFVDNKSFDVHHNVFEFTVRWKFYSDIRNRR